MPNPLFRTEILARVKNALCRAESASLFEHHGLAGHAREIFVHDLLRPLLPALVGIGTGKIADAKGGLSSECDAVLFSTGVLPPLLLGPGFGLFPINAALYCIEVKTKATAAEMRDAIGKARKLKALAPSGSQYVVPNFALFAYGSDLTVSSELERYRELDPDNEANPAFTALCVVGRGYWFSQHGRPGRSNWGYFPPTDAHDEVIDFLAGLANTLPRMIASQGLAPIGSYFSERTVVDVPNT